MNETDITLEALRQVDLAELKTYANRRFDELLSQDSGCPMIKNFLPDRQFVTDTEVREASKKQQKILDAIAEDVYHIILGQVIRNSSS